MRSWGRLSRASCIRHRAFWKASATQQVTASQNASDSLREEEGWVRPMNIISLRIGVSLSTTNKAPGSCCFLDFQPCLCSVHNGIRDRACAPQPQAMFCARNDQATQPMLCCHGVTIPPACWGLMPPQVSSNFRSEHLTSAMDSDPRELTVGDNQPHSNGFYLPTL